MSQCPLLPIYPLLKFMSLPGKYSSVYRRDPLLFILGPLYREFQDSFEYKMSSIAHVFWTVKRYKRNHKKFLLKNFFPKNNKEKNFVNNSGAHEAVNAFSKIYIGHLRIIHSLNAIYGPSTRHLIFKYRTSRTQKMFFLVSRAPRINFRIFVGRS